MGDSIKHGYCVALAGEKCPVTLMTTCYSRPVDVERTIESILKIQVRHEARLDAMEKRLDRRIDGITKLVHQGMRMLVRIETNVEHLSKAQKELAAAQKATDRTLRAFINSLHNGRNGH